MPTPDFSKIWASSSPLPDYTFTDAEYVEGWEFVGNAPPTKNEFDAWFRLVDTKLKWLYDQLNTTASKLYPVGSVYISFNSADPSTLFGGTWERLKDTFLLANGDAYAPNTTGGSATKNITVDNLPSHSHTLSADGNHTHVYQTPLRAIDVDRGTTSARSIWSVDDNGWYETSLNGLHSHTVGATGSNLPLNIMPPYKTVYMWKRIA
ncbi:MAG: hypothetical protein IKE94_13845 [Aeriscardovia sp.]|nr:hypothetical protein [Aeriscardovia sp.]